MATFDTSLLSRAPSLQPNLPAPVSAADMYNQMSKIRADREAIQQTNFLRQAYAASYNPQTGDVDYNTLARNVAQSPYAHLLPKVAEAQQAQAKSTAELATEAARQEEQKSLARLHSTQTEAANVEAKLKEADQAYNDVINFNSLDEMLSHAQEKLNSGVLPPDRFALVKSTIDQARNMKLTPDQQLNFAKSTFLLNTLNAKDRYAAMQPAEPLSPIGKLQSDLAAARARGDTKAVEQIEQAIKTASTHAPGTSVNVNTGEAAGAAFQKELGSKVATELDTLNTRAQSAASTLESAKQLKPLLESKDFISGTLGSQRLAIAKALGLAGADETQAYFAGMGRQVADLVKQFGSGTGISDADRAYAEKIAGGNIELTPDAIKRIVALNEKAAKYDINKYNSRKKFLSQKNPIINNYYEDIAAPASAPTSAGKYDDAAKEARYQAWKAQQGKK